MSSNLITLDVSGRKYKTQKATLQTSPYFRNLLARWDDNCDKEDDGSYVVDADGDTFQHILNFMRRPSKFPLFWTKEAGFDYVLYNKLEVEADYFLLQDLRDWIRQKRYLVAVRTTVQVIVISEADIKRLNKGIYTAGTEVQSYFGSYSGEKRYRCPCGTGANHSMYYSLCEKLVKVGGPHYDDPPKKLTLILKRIEFDETICENKSVS